MQFSAKRQGNEVILTLDYLPAFCSFRVPASAAERFAHQILAVLGKEPYQQVPESYQVVKLPQIGDATHNH